MDLAIAISIFVILGIISFIIIYKVKKNRFAIQGEIGEKEVSAIIKLTGKDTLLINNLMLKDGDNTHQIDHVAIRPNGIFCIETKNWVGNIYGTENARNWTRYMGNEKIELENPIKQNLTHIYQINKVLNNKYKIFSVIVMVQNNTQKIKANNVVGIDNLPKYLAKFNEGVSLSEEERQEIFDTLTKANATDITIEEHIENIHKQAEKIEQGICPRCGGKLVERNGKKGKFLGCENYPKCKFTKQIDEEKTA